MYSIDMQQTQKTKYKIVGTNGFIVLDESAKVEYEKAAGLKLEKYQPNANFIDNGWALNALRQEYKEGRQGRDYGEEW